MTDRKSDSAAFIDGNVTNLTAGRGTDRAIKVKQPAIPGDQARLMGMPGIDAADRSHINQNLSAFFPV